MDIISFNKKLQHPFNLICAAATQGGKSHWIREFLSSRMIDPFPQRIIYIHAFITASFSELEAIPGFEYRTSIPDNIAKEDFVEEATPSLIIIDDQMACSNEDVMNSFIRGSHHLNRSCILALQNGFLQNPCMRTISLNAHYMILFKQPRDILQIETLGRRMFSSAFKLFLQAYKSATKRNYGYLLIDLKSLTDERL